MPVAAGRGDRARFGGGPIALARSRGDRTARRGRCGYSRTGADGGPAGLQRRRGDRRRTSTRSGARSSEGYPDEEIEMIVVSDGSIDETGERLLAARGERGIRVIHYDRNLGQGLRGQGGRARVARRVGRARRRRSRSRPGVDPALPRASRDASSLDFAIGSKRHPDSVVHYPRSRRIASWCTSS